MFVIGNADLPTNLQMYVHVSHKEFQSAVSDHVIIKVKKNKMR